MAFGTGCGCDDAYADSNQRLCPGSSTRKYVRRISEYTTAVSTGELDGEDVYVTIDGKNFTEQDGFVVANTQNKENPPKFHLILTGCTFNDAVVSLGSQGKNTGGAASPSTGAFPITIQNNKTDVEVEQAYMAAESAEDIPSVTLEAGELLVKDADDTEVHTPVKVEAKAAYRYGAW